MGSSETPTYKIMRFMGFICSTIVLVCSYELAQTYPMALHNSGNFQRNLDNLVHHENQSPYSDLNGPNKRSFASFRFRPKSLESLIMKNKAYDMMNNINNMVEDVPADESMETLAKARAISLLQTKNPDVEISQ